MPMLILITCGVLLHVINMVSGNIPTVQEDDTIRKADPIYVTDEKFKSYRLEDFFWTGSGDGPDLSETSNNETDYQDNAVADDHSWRTTTVFHTTTVLFATVYPTQGSCGANGCSPTVSPVWTETVDFSSPVPSTTSPDIKPTPVRTTPKTTSTPEMPTVHPPVESFTVATEQEISEPPPMPHPVPPDQRYWLLTVLRTEEAPDIKTNVLEERLARLYQRAFMRRRIDNVGTVRVIIYNATKDGIADPRDLGIVYSVLVGGEPVPALAAAADMRLLSLSEVSAELGYPVLTKAERKQNAAYLKGVVPFGARVKGRSRDTWLLIGSVLAAVSLLAILAGLFTFGLSRSRSRRIARGSANRRQIYDGEEGTSNLGYEEDGEKKISGRSERPGAAVTFAEDQRRGSTSSSSCSGSSEASLVRLRMQQRRREMKKDDNRPKPRPRTRIRRVGDADIRMESEGLGGPCSARSRDTFTDGLDEGDSIGGQSPPNVSTPNSYLSMPSVKAFPRKARIPEPLNRVLEPISIRHLDADAEGGGVYPSSHKKELPLEAKNKYVRGVTRHGSLEGDDPGVIGPVVWDRHCQELQALDRDNVEDGGSGNVSRMRKRFGELLDDAFNMFGSRPDEAVEVMGVHKPADPRIKSAVVKSKDNATNYSFSARPKTTDSKRPQTAIQKTPRGAWDTPNSLTPGRPSTAAPSSRKQPVIDANLILVDSELPPTDPAVPLIAAIKDELKKFNKFDGSQ